MRVLWNKGVKVLVGTCPRCETTFSAEEWELKGYLALSNGKREVSEVCPKCNCKDLILKPKGE